MNYNRLPRFIPTPVGNGLPGAPTDIVLPVYPHACGERGVTVVVDSVTVGLSPRLWGTGGGFYRWRRDWRFIPTPVGNGQFVCGCWTGATVYPHACGERAFLALWFQPVLRFIPTPVGNGSYFVSSP